MWHCSRAPVILHPDLIRHAFASPKLNVPSVILRTIFECRQVSSLQHDITAHPISYPDDILRAIMRMLSDYLMSAFSVKSALIDLQALSFFDAWHAIGNWRFLMIPGSALRQCMG